MKLPIELLPITEMKLNILSTTLIVMMFQMDLGTFNSAQNITLDILMLLLTPQITLLDGFQSGVPSSR